MDEKTLKICEKNLKTKHREIVASLNKMGFKIKKGEFPLPTLSFDLRGRVAGKAFLLKNHIKLNRDIVSNPKHFKDITEDTLYHELAHLVVAFLHRSGRFWKPNKISQLKILTKPKPHGYEWQSIMVLMGQEPVTRHSFETTAVRTVAKITYVCRCMEHEITKIKHDKIQKGALYSCKKCRGFLEIKEGATFTKK